MSTDDESMISAQEAEDVLDACLNEEDVDLVRGVFKDISSQIRWGRVIQELLPELYDGIEDLSTESSVLPQTHFLKGPAWDKVVDQDAEEFEAGAPRSSSRERLLQLSLVRKLLIVMKTHVDQKIAGIPILSPNEESELFHLAQPSRGADDDGQEYYENDLDPEEERQMKEIDRILRTEVQSTEGECDHRRGSSKTRRVLRSGVPWLVWHCGACDSDYKSVLSGGGERSRQSAVCFHTGVRWRAGHEGSVAECSSCKEEVPNPEEYEWVKAGLEPYGDNPDDDEVIILCSGS